MMNFKLTGGLKRLSFLIVLLVGGWASQASAQSGKLVSPETAREILKNQILILEPQMGNYTPGQPQFKTLGRKVVYYSQILYMLDQKTGLADAISKGVYVLQSSDEYLQGISNVPDMEATLGTLVNQTTVLLTQ